MKNEIDFEQIPQEQLGNYATGLSMNAIYEFSKDKSFIFRIMTRFNAAFPSRGVSELIRRHVDEEVIEDALDKGYFKTIFDMLELIDLARDGKQFYIKTHINIKCAQPSPKYHKHRPSPLRLMTIEE